MGVIARAHLQQGLGTLDTHTGVIITTKPPILKDFRMLKWEGKASVDLLTAGEGQNMGLYIADGDLSLSEAMAALDSNAPVGPNDGVGASVADRFVKLIAVAKAPSSGSITLQFVGPNGSPILSFSPRWTFATTKSWNFILVNDGPQLTTGSQIDIRGTAFGVFLR